MYGCIMNFNLVDRYLWFIFFKYSLRDNRPHPPCHLMSYDIWDLIRSKLSENALLFCTAIQFWTIIYESILKYLTHIFIHRKMTMNGDSPSRPGNSIRASLQARNLWIRVALFEKELSRIIEYITQNHRWVSLSSQWGECKNPPCKVSRYQTWDA